MKTAKSLVYGGELIDAIDCNYDDFKRLAPLCPNCSSPVHLKAGGDRLSTKGKAYTIAQHWSHFAGKSAEEVAACELRVNGYSDAEREKIQRVARGQREKWIRRWLWRAFEEWSDSQRIIKDGSELRLLPIKEIIKHSGLRPVKGVGLYCSTGKHDLVVKRFRSAAFPESFFTRLRKTVEGKASGEYCPLVESHFMGVDLSLHQKISLQIADYLKARNSKGLLELFIETASIFERNTFAVFFLDQFGGKRLTYDQAVRMAGKRDYCDAMVFCLFCQIVRVPWASEFARLEALEAAKANP